MLTGAYIEIVLMELAKDMSSLGMERLLDSRSELFGEYIRISDEDVLSARAEVLAGPIGERLARVYSICGEGYASRLFDLSCACLVHPELVGLLESSFSGCSLETCAVLSGAEPDLIELEQAYDRAKLLLMADGGAGPCFRRRFSADDHLLCFLEGSLDTERSLAVASLISPDPSLQKLYIDEQYVDEIASALKVPSVLVQLSGENGRGRRLLLSYACMELGLHCFMVDAARLAEMKDDSRSNALKRIRREILLSGHVLCYYGLKDEGTWPLEGFLRECVDFMPEFEHPICVCTGSSVQLIEATSRLVYKTSLPRLTRTEHIALWEGYSGQYSLTGVDCFHIGSKYKLSPLQIKKAAARLAVIQKAGRAVNEQTVGEVCADVLPPAEGNIKRVSVSYTIDDLVLPPEQIQLLHSICAHVEYSRLVYDDWDMASRFSYGRNVSALFVGAPGTGKTMAVHVLSNMLHLPLYHVDLSQVVDKYVGETEKRLEEIFDVAEKSNTILFFDEADGIFGKRSDVQDSKDKYANTQASYILQRIEQFEGVVILATNFNKNIDEAFMRRIRYLVEFQKPSEELRLLLWRGAFAANTPLEDIDFPYLARSFELTGGAIKNIALNAAFLAAADSSPITMKHILLSLREENKKLGKTMLKKDFADYGILFS